MNIEAIWHKVFRAYTYLVTRGNRYPADHRRYLTSLL